MNPHESASEVCRRTRVQNCHICENADCTDNRTPSIVQLRLKVKEMEGEIGSLTKKDVTAQKIHSIQREANRKVKKAEEERDRVAESFHSLAERFSDLENAVVNGIIIFGGKSTTMREMVDAVKTAKAIGGEDER